MTSIAQQALNLSAADEKLLAASMLTVPSELYLFEQLQGFDVDGLLDARDCRAKSGYRKRCLAGTVPQICIQRRIHADAESMANRALANIAFSYWCQSLAAQQDVQALAQLLQERYSQADNLTDRRTVLSLAARLLELDEQARQHILNDFYTQWQSEALVIDLWFNVQAQSLRTDVSAVQVLTEHSGFDRKNPNRVRSVYGAFGMLNLRRLHALDGSGYEFVANAVPRWMASIHRLLRV